MADVSVLLNLTSGLSLEDSDPFMSLVAEKGLATDKGTLLFYDQLSTRRFPTERSQYNSHLENLLSNLRNLLESRSLSTLDKGEDVRLIVTMDIANGLFEPEEKGKLCFPAQKVRFFKQRLESVFGGDNPFLLRFKYLFIFLESTLPSSSKLASFYRSAAFEGVTGDTQEWINTDLLKVSFEHPKETPEETDSIDIIPEAKANLENIRKVAKKVKEEFLDKADAGDAFMVRLEDKLKEVSLWKDFTQTDFGSILRSSLRSVIGLSSEEFNNNNSFFLIKFTGAPATVKRRDEAFVLSLILLLVTITENDYKELLNNGAGRVFVMDKPSTESFDKDKLCQLSDLIQLCLNKLKEDGDQRKKESDTVSFKEYSSRSQTPREVDSHTPQNDKILNAQTDLYNDFVNKRKVPFFFGPKPEDWSWWISVEESLDNLLRHEKENSYPLYDPPRRITDKEMSSEDKECSYSELKVAIGRLKEEESESLPIEDVNEYLKTRKQRLADLKEARGKLLSQLLKLGYLFNATWITVFLTIAVTICYSFHFFVKRAGDPKWIIACFIVVLVLFLIGMITARSQIKLKIESAIQKIQSLYDQLNKDKEAFLKQVEERAKKQIEADVRRRNLTEKQEKLDAFNSHNLQVDKWESYYAAVHKKMNDTLELLGFCRSDGKVSSDLALSNFTVDGFPSIPSELTKAFWNSNTTLANGTKEITDVLCFVKSFNFTICED